MRARDIWTVSIPTGVDTDAPGILAIEVDDIGTYVVSSNKIGRRMREYEIVVRRLAAGDPYKPQQPEYREIHHILHEAVTFGRPVACVALENCDEADLGKRRAYWTRMRGTLNRRP